MLFQAVEASMQPSFRHEREHLHLNAGSAHLNMSFILLYLLGSCHIHAMFKMKALLVLVSGTTACMAGALWRTVLLPESHRGRREGRLQKS